MCFACRHDNTLDEVAKAGSVEFDDTKSPDGRRVTSTTGKWEPNTPGRRGAGKDEP